MAVPVEPLKQPLDGLLVVAATGGLLALLLAGTAAAPYTLLPPRLRMTLEGHRLDAAFMAIAIAAGIGIAAVIELVTR